MEKYYNVKEMAQMFGVKPQTIYRKIYNNILPGVVRPLGGPKYRGKILFVKSVIDQYLAQQYMPDEQA